MDTHQASRGIYSALLWPGDARLHEQGLKGHHSPGPVSHNWVTGVPVWTDSAPGQSSTAALPQGARVHLPRTPATHLQGEEGAVIRS